MSGDGRADLLVGEPSWRIATGQWAVADDTLRGRAWLYSTGNGLALEEEELAELYGGADTWLAGSALDLVPDVDGDGQGEVLIGAYLDDRQYLGAGAAVLFKGPVVGKFSLGAADTTLFGGEPNQGLGYSVGPAGDLDGDGLADWFAGVPAANDFQGMLLVMTGGLIGEFEPEAAAITILGDAPGDAVGVDATTLGDFDGDGADDLAVGAVGWVGGSEGGSVGTVCIYYGPRSEGSWTLDGADACIRGEDERSSLGLHLGGGQDVDQDGWPDLVASAVGAAFEDEALGAIFVFAGGGI